MAPIVKVRDAIQMVEDDGWYLVTIRGDHRHYKHMLKSGRVTIPGKPNKDLSPATYHSILKQAGLRGSK